MWRNSWKNPIERSTRFPVKRPGRFKIRKRVGEEKGVPE
jgi:hypothetical protein